VEDALTDGLSTGHAVKKLRSAVARNAADLCALTGASLRNCEVELNDLGVAQPRVKPAPHQPQQEEETKAPTDGSDNTVVVITFVAAFCIFKLAMFFYLTRAKKVGNEEDAVTNELTKAAQSESTTVTESKMTACMEEGKVLHEKQPTEDDGDNNSTLAPSSDKESEPSLNGDSENAPTRDLGVLRALSDQSI